MDDQLTFDLRAAQGAGRKAMDESAARDMAWYLWAKERVMELARRYGEVCVDDLRAICDEAGRHPRDNRAFGAVFRSLVARGVLEVSGERPSAVRTSHGRPVRVFRRVMSSE